jgi:hypothetical protein
MQFTETSGNTLSRLHIQGVPKLHTANIRAYIVSGLFYVAVSVLDDISSSGTMICGRTGKGWKEAAAVKWGTTRNLPTGTTD